MPRRALKVTFRTLHRFPTKKPGARSFPRPLCAPPAFLAVSERVSGPRAADMRAPSAEKPHAHKSIWPPRPPRGTRIRVDSHQVVAASSRCEGKRKRPRANKDECGRARERADETTEKNGGRGSAHRAQRERGRPYARYLCGDDRLRAPGPRAHTATPH